MTLIAIVLHPFILIALGFLFTGVVLYASHSVIRISESLWGIPMSLILSQTKTKLNGMVHQKSMPFFFFSFFD
jgi:hypothetical protein